MIAATVARLTGSPFRIVSGVADVPEAEEDVKVTPSAFVMPSGDKAGPNQLGGGALQQDVQPAIMVILAVSRKGAASRAALDPLKAYREAVMDKLLNWSPLADYAPYEFGGGGWVRVGKSILLWQDTFTTEYLLRKV